ncbi:BlaI/MecI/CopY family transcriptional regulator [Arundinibacter roseus]|uniref:BlaI/MecI/CopY family transcriptional regulator n=1 Tax=Arundinibacter roseus TaxID=2070510 RepID=A0A4R4JWI2_9BACT|nr:BlaI/MecI/CopY family transcriptional regulator [Arundinibacter roseus]TDB59108.1 BlaI/MecI/CopY family transcriptional regulator [Arundinibacter roseus]
MANHSSFPPKPTDSELEILSFLWQHGPSTVRQVHDHLAETKEAGYTTTLKLMQIMHEKELLSRTEEGRSHVYTAKVQEAETRQTLLDRFVETTFRGSAAQLVMQALGNHKTSARELDEIRQLLNNLENNH